MYIVGIGVIAIACVLVCKSFQRRGRNPIFVILISIGLALGVLFAVPMIQSGGLRTPSTPRTSSSPVQVRYMLVGSDALNVRRGPSADHGVVGQLSKNARVQVLDSSGQWWRIRSGNIEGYVNSRFLINEDRKPSSTSSSTTSTTVQPEPGAGTTRSATYQRQWEEANEEYYRTYTGIPGNLRLPSGETVSERAASGRVYGK